MSRPRREGVCRICGTFGPLTYEHIPPKSGFNDRPVVMQTFDEYESGRRGRTLQRGAGEYALCARCNNRTGGWYGAAFAEWCVRGMDLRARIGGRMVDVDVPDIYPLRVIKQVATMMMASAGPQFREKNPALEAFVLDPEHRGLSSHYRFFTFLCAGGRGRRTGVVGSMNLESQKNPLNVLAEVVHPPFGYVLSLQGELHDGRPAEITHFANYEYDDRATVPLRVPALPTLWIMPGDYRSAPEIHRDGLINDLEAVGHPDPRAAADDLLRGG